MKSAALILFASLTITSIALADDTQVHAFIGADQMHVKATVSEVTWSSNLEDVQINDTRAEKSGTFILHCGGDAREYIMISIPAANDVWPSQSEDLRTKADVVAFGSDLEIHGAELLSTKVGNQRVMYVDLDGKAAELVRHWGTGMSVRVSARPGNGLSNLSFIVAASAPSADTTEKMAQTAALCQLLAN